MSTVTRKTLYEQIWDQPMTAVAKEYGVSSNYLARVCEELNIPRPSRGYWARRAAGKRTIKATLPAPDPGDDEVWERGPRDYHRRRLPVPVFKTTPTERQRKRKPTTHPLVLDVTRLFEDSKPRRYDDDGYLKPKSSNALPDVFVSQATLARALRLANKVYLHLEDRGHWVRAAAKGFDTHVSALESGPTTEKASRRPYEVKERWRPRHATLVFIGGVAIGLTIFEIAESIPAVYRDGSFRPATRAEIREDEGLSWSRVSEHSLPNGRLGVFAYSPYPRASWERYWREEKPGDLIGMLDAIARELEAGAPAIAELEAEGERQEEERHREYKAAQRKRYEAAVATARNEAMVKSRDQLLNVIEAWATALHVEQFLSELRAAVERQGEHLSEELAQRFQIAVGLFGGTNALSHFNRWKTPEEAYEEPRYW